MSFTALGLSDLLSDTIKALYDTPTSLQEQAIPIILQNNDLMVATPTGTGKIVSFASAIIEKLFPKGNITAQPLVAKQARVLILVINQDEAIQITDFFNACSLDFSLTTACILDNVSIIPQIKILGRGVDVLIASPTRLVELMNQDAIDLTQIQLLVLDEAELLTNNEFNSSTKQVVEKLPATRQTLLYATSFTDDVIVAAHFLLKTPERIEITVTPSIEHIKQCVYSIPTRQKSALLVHLINTYKWSQLLVFTRTKYGASRLAGYLNRKGISTNSIYPSKAPNSRNKTLADLQEQRIQVLIVTDVAIDSLDISSIPCIINFDLPYIEDDYVQRINTIQVNEAISFISPEEEKLLLVIEDYIKYKIPDADMSGFIFDEQETTTKSNDRFRRIFRHPAVGRKSRKKLVTESIIDENKAAYSDEDILSEPKTTRSTKSPFNRVRAKNTRNPYNKHRRTTTPLVDLDTLPPDRPEDEFRDDEYDNFGNSVDYISPYQSKEKSSRNKRFTSKTANNEFAAPKTSTPHQPKTKTSRSTKAHTLNHQTEQRRPRNSLYRRNIRNASFANTNYSEKSSIVTTPTPIRSPSEFSVRRTSTTVPAIIHKKHSRVDRLPTLENLDSLPNRHIPKTEKPMLLSRKTLDDE